MRKNEDGTYTYKGRTIMPCSWEDSRKAGYHWYIRSCHYPSGIPWDEHESTRCRSLQQAMESIDWEAQYE